VRLPVSVDSSFKVTRLGRNSIGSNLVRSSLNPFVSSQSGSANYVLLFDSGPLTPVGVTVFRISKSSTDPQRQGPTVDSVQPYRSLTSSMNANGDSDDVVATNGLVTVRFDR
jgi:hypothetical protein